MSAYIVHLCVICNLNRFHSFISKLSIFNYCSHIEDMHQQRRFRAEFGIVYFFILDHCIHKLMVNSEYVVKTTPMIVLRLLFTSAL